MGQASHPTSNQLGKGPVTYPATLDSVWDSLGWLVEESVLSGPCPEFGSCSVPRAIS